MATTPTIATPTITKQRLLTTRILAATSFTAYVYSQSYALTLPSPRVSKLYGPHEAFVIAFFAASTLLNVYWLRQLFFKWDYVGDVMPLAFGWYESPYDLTNEKSKNPSRFIASKRYNYGLSSAQVTCLPFHILGNLFLTGWSFAWCNGHYLVSQVLLACCLSVQLYTVFILLHVEHDDFITPINYLTHLVMKTNAGLIVLFMWKNWGVVDQIASPQIAEMVNSGVIFLLMTIGSGPDPTVGICLLYNLTALLFGETQSEAWNHAFHWFMIVITAALMVELHLSEQEKFSWLKGFNGRVVRDAKYALPLHQETTHQKPSNKFEYGFEEINLETLLAVDAAVPPL